jgi:hypothetical protein
MTGPQPRSHEVDSKVAAAMIERHRKQVTVQGARAAGEGDVGGMFSAAAVVKMLQQPGAQYLRFYFGRNEQGNRELILVAADADGNDMTTVALDQHWPCPPFCPPTASVLRG